MAATISLPPDRTASHAGANVHLAPVRRAADHLDRGLRLPDDVYRRRRLVVLALVVGLALGVLSLGREAGASRTAEAEAGDAVIYVVQPGDTLWDIARSMVPGSDPRPLVAELSDISGGSLLQPGQQLVVPAHLVG